MQKKSEEVMELNRLSVQSEIRGLGIARKLVNGIIEEARKAGYSQVSISPTFYEQLFCTKVFFCSFYVLTVKVCNFLA